MTRLVWHTVVEGNGATEPGVRTWTNEPQAHAAKTWYESEKDRDAVVVGPQEDRPDPAEVLADE